MAPGAVQNFSNRLPPGPWPLRIDVLGLLGWAKVGEDKQLDSWLNPPGRQQTMQFWEMFFKMARTSQIFFYFRVQRLGILVPS